MAKTVVITGSGRFLTFETPDNPEIASIAGARQVAPGLFVFPDNCPQYDEENSGLLLYKEDFIQADKSLGLASRHGPASFISIAQYFASFVDSNHALYTEIKVSLNREYYRKREVLYCLGQSAVADMLYSIDNEGLVVPGIMSPPRLMLVRAVLGDCSDQVEGGVHYPKEDILTAFAESGFDGQVRTATAGEHFVFQALGRTRICLVKGMATIKVGQAKMRHLLPGDEFELTNGDKVEILAGVTGMTYVRGSFILA